MFLLLREVHLRTLLRSIRAVWMLSVMAGISYYLGQRLMPFNSKVDFSSYLILVLSITSKKFPFKLPKWESDPFTFSTYCLQSTLTSIFSTFTAMAIFPLILITNRFCQYTGILDDYKDPCTDWKMLTPALWHFFFCKILEWKYSITKWSCWVWPMAYCPSVQTKTAVLKLPSLVLTSFQSWASKLSQWAALAL